MLRYEAVGVKVGDDWAVMSLPISDADLKGYGFPLTRVILDSDGTELVMVFKKKTKNGRLLYHIQEIKDDQKEK